MPLALSTAWKRNVKLAYYIELFSLSVIVFSYVAWFNKTIEYSFDKSGLYKWSGAS